MEDLHNLDNVLANLVTAGAIIPLDKFHQWGKWVKILRSVCREVGRWQQESQFDKVYDWPHCENFRECSAVLEFCSYY